jgi:hypothetical protein
MSVQGCAECHIPRRPAVSRRSADGAEHVPGYERIGGQHAQKQFLQHKSRNNSRPLRTELPASLSRNPRPLLAGQLMRMAQT